MRGYLRMDLSTCASMDRLDAVIAQQPSKQLVQTEEALQHQRHYKLRRISYPDVAHPDGAVMLTIGRYKAETRRTLHLRERLQPLLSRHSA